MSTIQALPSSYNGINFRSRMEARWAVFMDSIGVSFFYEAEGYDLGGVYYLPDFYVPHMDAFIEIKNPLAERADFEKCELLCKAIGKVVYIYTSPPRLPDFGDDCEWGMALFPPTAKCPRGGEDYGYWWCQCPHCGRKEIQFNGRADRIACGCPRSWHGDKGYNFDTPLLRKAYTRSLSYRFEEPAEVSP